MSARRRRPAATGTAMPPAPVALPVPTTPAPEALVLSTPVEATFADWRERLARNFSRRSVGRWEPLTHPKDPPGPT